jgi:hypothetical protein
MTIMKLDYRLTGAVTDALAPHVERIFEHPGATFMGVVEFRHTSRLELADDEKDDEVKCRAVGIEVASPGAQENTLRELQRSLWTVRTADGTLTEENELRLAKQTLDTAGKVLNGVELARLAGALKVYGEQLAAMAGDSSLREADLRRKVGELARGMSRVRIDAQLEIDGADA